MAYELVSLDLPPGIMKQGTEYETKGRWSDAHLVRFTEGTIRPVGGWRRMLDSTSAAMAALSGKPRGGLAWRASDGSALIAFGTTSKLYLITAALLKDITPAGYTTGVADGGVAGGVGAWGAGAWGAGPYGGGSSLAALVQADTWQLDNFGGFLIAMSTSDGKLYVWSGDPDVAAAVPTATGGVMPTGKAVVVTPERFVMVLDKDTVSWADQESLTDWDYASTTNQAGQQPLATTGHLVCGRRGRGVTMLWTDQDMWLASYLGLPQVYSFAQAGDHCGIIAPNAVAVWDGRAAWMGAGKFYGFDGGAVQEIPCEVSDYVFSDLTTAQRAKIHARVITRYSEIWWFYPSATSAECDRYVVYNHIEKHWTIGALARASGTTDGPTDYPVLVTSDGLIYEHEFLNDRQGEVPFVESGPFEITDQSQLMGMYHRSEGNSILKIKKLVPDEKTVGDVAASIYTSFYPTETPVLNGPYTLTKLTDVRLSARQLRLRFQEAVDTDWRIGTMRMGLQKGGKR